MKFIRAVIPIVLVISLFALSYIEATIGYLAIVFITIYTSRYINTTIHEFGHFLAGKGVKFTIKEVVIGEQIDRMFFRFKLFNTEFRFNLGAGGSTSAEINNRNNIKIKVIIYILGGITSQIIVAFIVFLVFGVGQDEMFIPLIYMAVSLYSVCRSLIPKRYYFNNKLFPSDGLLALRIIKMSEDEITRKLFKEAPDFT